MLTAAGFKGRRQLPPRYYKKKKRENGFIAPKGRAMPTGGPMMIKARLERPD